MGKRYLLFMSFAALASFAAGCGPDLASVCEQQEACLGGNEADVDACIAAAEGQYDADGDIGCADEFDVLFECINPKLQCLSQGTGQQCMADADCNGTAVCSNSECTVKAYGVEASAQDDCEAEQAAYTRCR